MSQKFYSREEVWGLAGLQKDRRVGPVEKAVGGEHFSKAPWQGRGWAKWDLDPLAKPSVLQGLCLQRGSTFSQFAQSSPTGWLRSFLPLSPARWAGDLGV